MVVKNNNVKFAEYTAKCRKAAEDIKKTIKSPKGLINPELDHIVSIGFGYAHGIPWYIISKPENFIWIDRKSNRSKGDNLNDQGRAILAEWFEQKLIDRPIGVKNTNDSEFDFTPITKMLKTFNDVVTAIIPISAALAVKAIWCQRIEEFRFEKTKRALGHVFLPTHKIMQFVVYPDGRIERADGNTRAYIFKHNYQFPDYEVPEDIFAIFYKVKDDEHAEQIYHSIDSSLTAESFSEKLSGYIRHHGYDAFSIPKKWKKGESVYDMAVVVLENYIPQGEHAVVSLDRTGSDGEKAAKTAEKLDYFIQEMIVLGNMIGQSGIPRRLTAPLLGMMIRYLMVTKNDKTLNDRVISGFQAFIDYMLEDSHAVFSRKKYVKDPAFRNFLIMLDELQTTEENGKTLNPYIQLEASTRRIIPDVPTKTTANWQDRRVYCGWIAYCIDKYLKNEVMDEDIVFDVTKIKLTNNTPLADANSVVTKAKSAIMTKYDDFWKTYTP